MFQVYSVAGCDPEQGSILGRGLAHPHELIRMHQAQARDLLHHPVQGSMPKVDCRNGWEATRKPRRLDRDRMTLNVSHAAGADGLAIWGQAQVACRRDGH
jgi:hypothetical protein